MSGKWWKKHEIKNKKYDMCIEKIRKLQKMFLGGKRPFTKIT